MTTRAQPRTAGAAHRPTPAVPGDGRTLPTIVARGNELRDTTAAALAAITAANRPPTVFQRSDSLVRVRQDQEGRPLIEAFDSDRLRGRLARVADWVVFDARANAFKHVSPPDDVTADVLVLGDWSLPVLLGVVQLPILRADGSVFVRRGYDPVTKLFYAPPLDFHLPSIPDAPTAAELAVARDVLLDVVCDFPFVDDASRAAAIAATVTTIVRPFIAGPTPLFLFDKPQAGTGASLLADAIAVIATGQPAAMMGAPGDDAEWDKRMLAALAAGTALIVIDNVDAPLQSGALARALTSTTYRGRVLGHSRIADYPQRAVWIATGINLTTRGDIGRRSIWCRMDAKLSQPWKRAGFRHPQLLAWIAAQRGVIVAAALTLARGWLCRGCPDGGVPLLGSFEAWTQTVSGMLSVGGVEGFLSNLNELYTAADDGGLQWTAFCAALADRFHRNTFTSADVAQALHCDGSPLLATLPDDLAVALGKPTLQRIIGAVFAKRVETRFDSRRLVKAGTHARATLWRVVTDQED